MKRFIICLIFLSAILFPPIYGDESVSREILNGQLEQLNLGEMDDFLMGLDGRAKAHLPDLSAKDLIQRFSEDGFKGLGKDLFKMAANIFADELVSGISLLMRIVILSILCAVLQGIGGSFESEEVSKLAYYVCYISMMLLLVKCFQDAMNIGYEVISDMSGFMSALMPNLFIALLSVSNNTSMVLLRPVLFAAVTLVTNIMRYTVMPLIYFSAVLTIVTHISDKVQISKLRDFFNQVAVGIIGISTTVFIGAISIQKIFVTSFNGLTSQATKFALDNFIPVIGGFLSSAYDLVLSCSVIIKNGIGLFGLLVLILIAALPFIKIVTIFIIFKITSALIQPMMDNQVTNCLSDLSGSLFLLIVCLSCVLIMFFVGITIIMSTGNQAIMMR